MQPIRIQRSRLKKQVSPNGLPIVYVGRPSKYANPYKLGTQLNLTREECLNLFKKYLAGAFDEEEIIEDLKVRKLLWY